MSKARMLSALMLVCLLVLGICSWAGAEEVIIVDTSLTERVAVPADEPIISGSVNPMLGESYTYTIHYADLVDNLTVYVFEATHTSGNTYSLTNGIVISLDANDSFEYTFSSERDYMVYITYVKNGEDKTSSLLVTSVDRSAQLGQKVAEIVQACIQSGASTDYEKAVWLHDYLTSHAYYDNSLVEHGPDGVLLKGYGVCDSYCKAYQMLLNEFGIPNHRQEGRGNGGNHAWNVVYLNGQWCQIDVTWDDPGDSEVPVSGNESHNYFGLTDNLMGVDHDYSITYPCNSLDNMYYVRNGLPAVYTQFIDNGGLGKTGLLAQAAQGLETISYDVSDGYCVYYEESSGGFSYSLDDYKDYIVFPVMAYIKSRTPMAGPNGEDVYYAFTYENNTLTGVRSNGPAVDEPVLNLTYEVGGTPILPGASVALGQTITVNWEITNPDAAPDGFSYYLFLETTVTLGEDNTVDASMIQKQGGFLQGSELIAGISASGSFTITPQEGDCLRVQKALKLYADNEYTTVETWDEDVFTLTGSQTEPLDAEVVFSLNAEKRTVRATITSNVADRIRADWYADEETAEKKLGASMLFSGQTAQAWVTQNVENAILLVFTLSDTDRGLSCKKVFSVDPTGFATLTADACGMNLTWTIQNGTLILSGSGAMYDYAYGRAPWYSQCSQIASIQFPVGITELGEMAFVDTAVTQVSFPNTLELISDAAFWNCTSLTSVSIPSSVREIGNDAFYMCDSLTTFTVDTQNPWYKSENGIIVTKDGTQLVAIPEGAQSLVLPDGLTTIPSMSSFDESHAWEITIPLSVTRIEDDFVWNGSPYGELTDVYYLGTRTQFAEIERKLPDGSVTGMFPVGNMINLHLAMTPENKRLILPQGTQTIEAEAFAGIQAEEVVIPFGATTIGAGAFSGNSSLIIANIPGTVTQIGEGAFSGCHPDLVIMSQRGSAAETYANNNGIFFEVFDIR